MSKHNLYGHARAILATAVFAAGSWPAAAQVPVDENGNTFGDYDTAGEPATLGDDGVPLRSADELESLVGPIALYPDDLLAVVLPAATYPLQLVEAARFLEDLESNPALEPDEDWDDSIVALVNYPEVVEMMNEDLDWTWQLGEAVVAQQADVIAAIAAFRDKAQAAGNLKSDEHQSVTRNEDDIIEIESASEEVIYVPYYEPERVVVYQPQPVYYYYPRAYPLYYYPYPAYYSFGWGYFWGVTTAFTIGWNAHCLNVYHPSYYGHPYYGYDYWNHWWYRRPTVVTHNSAYYDQQQVRNRYYEGDRWRPNGYTRLHSNDQRITRNRYSPNPATAGAPGQQNRMVATRQNPPRATTASRGRTDDTVRPSGAGEMRNIRQALEASGASRDRDQSLARVRHSANDSRMTVRELRQALDASRQVQHTPRDRGPTVSRPAIPTERPAIPTARPAIPTERPAVPTARPAIPAPRPTVNTWTESRRPPSGPMPVRQAAPERSAPVRQQAPAPAVRAPASVSRPPPQSRPAPQHATAPRRSTQSR
jgi:hypothetical protein